MQAKRYALTLLIFALLFSSKCASAQTNHGTEARRAFDMRQSEFSDAAPSSTGSAIKPIYRSAAVTPEGVGPFSRFGFAGHAGLGGLGFDMATPLTRRFQLRSGSDFFHYATDFRDQNAQVNANLRLRSAYGALDWYPFAGRFRLSPRIVFGNNNRVKATYGIPAGNTITLNGNQYISSTAEPLHGDGSIDFRRTSPGLTIGYGNLLSYRGGRFSAPVEVGFYYAGQPALKVNFGGSACYPGLPESIACIPASKDPDFQQDLNAFIARNRHNLSYASYFPVFTLGLGYVF